MINTVQILSTDVGDFPAPPHMIEAAKGVRFRKDRWPDMRTKAGRNWVALFKRFSDEKIKEWMAHA